MIDALVAMHGEKEVEIDLLCVYTFKRRGQ